MQLLIDTPSSDLAAVLSCLEQLAMQRSTIRRAAAMQPPPAGLAALGARMQRFLDEFSRLVCAGVIDLKVPGPAAAAAICRGLGVLPVLVDAGVVRKDAGKALRATASQLTHALCDVFTTASDPGDREATAATLDLLTWLSRGLKAGLLADDDPTTRAAFDSALDRMPAWAAAPVRSGLDAGYLAACFVQLNTIRQFGLLPLEGNGPDARKSRQRLLQVMASLCMAFPGVLAGVKVASGVQTANVGNTIKDFIDAGLLPQQTHDWLVPVIGILLQRMRQAPREEMAGNGGQALANCANLLRMLSETGLYLQPAFLSCLPGYQAACRHLAGMVTEAGALLRGADGQSLSNLMSFVKAMAKQEERSKAASAPRALAGNALHGQLKAAARRLVQLLERMDFTRQSPQSVSGLLSAVAYVWARRMAPADQCGPLAQRLIAAIPHLAVARWETATAALSLRAIVQLHGLGETARPGAKAAFLRLLEFISRKTVHDDTQRLYCLQALELARLEQWTTIEQGTMQAALRGLLQWQGTIDPDVAQLQTAIVSLAHREEAPSPMLEAEEAGPASMPPPPPPPPPLPGTASRSPPGSKLADAGRMAEPGKAAGRNGASVTYRAPASSTTASSTTASSTTASSTTASSTASAGTASSTRASRPAGNAQPGAAGRGKQANAADPVTQWFTLASGAERAGGLIDQMMRLASGKNTGMVNRTDEYGNGALYYAVVAGKPELVQWLLRHPDFVLARSLKEAKDLLARLEQDIFSSISWTEAKQALGLVAGEMRRAWPEEETEDGASRSVSSVSTASSAPSRKGKQARTARKQAPDWETDPVKRKAEWFRLARGRDGGGETRQRMRRLAEIDPAILHSVDESGADALLLATRTRKQEIVKWLWAMNEQADPQPALFRHLKAKIAAAEVAELDASTDRIQGEQELARSSGLLSAHAQKGQSATQPAASAGQVRAKPPTIAQQMEAACASGDTATMQRLLRTADGAKWAMSWRDPHGDNLLFHETRRGNAAMVEVLLALNGGELADQVSPSGYTALLMAAAADDIDLLKVLLRHYRRSAVAHGVANGRDALLAAAASGAIRCVKYLLARDGGSLATALSNDSETALIIAARQGHGEVVRAMIDYGDVDIIDHHNRQNANALTVAAEAGHAAIVAMLVRARASLAWAANDDMTPLLLAAQAGHADVVRALLASPEGALLAKCVVSERRLNALDLALRNGHAEAASVLRDFDGGSLVRKPAQ